MGDVCFNDIWLKYWKNKEMINFKLNSELYNMNIFQNNNNFVLNIKARFYKKIDDLKEKVRPGVYRKINDIFKIIMDFTKIKSFQFTTNDIDILLLLKLLKNHFKYCDNILKYKGYNEANENDLGLSNFKLLNYNVGIQKKFYKIIIKYFIEPKVFKYVNFLIELYYNDAIKNYRNNNDLQ